MMKNLYIKIYFMVIFVFSLGAVVFAQEISVNQSPTSSDRARNVRGSAEPSVVRPSNIQRSTSSDQSSSDVIEIETEIGSPQIKSSDIVDKPKIKPRSDYSKGKINKKESLTSESKSSELTIKPSTFNSQSSMSNDQRPVSSVEPSATSHQPPASNVQQSSPNPQLLVTSTQPPIEAITDEQIIEMSMSLRKLIEDNNKLKSNLVDLDQQLRAIRGQQVLDNNRLTEVSLERDALKKQNENIIATGSEAQNRLQVLQKELTQKEEDYSLQIVRLQTELAQKLRDNDSQQLQLSKNESLTTNPQPLATDQNRLVSVELVSAPVDVEARERGEKILLALDNVSDQRQKLARDEAKVHYNMGNTYFNQGAYKKAAQEYGRALELAPEDASAHYNLAFVSGEFLNDPKIALDHYKEYLFFNPQADDASMVRQKIIEAEVVVRGNIRFKSKIDEEMRNTQNEANEAFVQ